jgi:DHA1 family tetracycline resistance protein-like MFS transporter
MTEAITSKKIKTPSQIFIFITIFIYLLGFGIMIPILPAIAKEAGGSSLVSGALIAVFSLMQFVFAPFWGKLSDQYGRRPILLTCLLGEAFAYFLMTLSSDLTTLFISRILAGFFGASISTASAYISDITSEKDRSKGMALIGVAFGLGFLLGPAIGGGLSHLGMQWYGSELAGVKLIAMAVTLVCVSGFFFGLFYLKESLDLTHPQKKERSSRLQTFIQVYKRPVVGSLIFVNFLAATAMACLESTLVLLMKDRYDWTISQISLGMVYVGVISLLSQGFLVRKLLPLLGEPKVLKLGLGLMIISFLGISTVPDIYFLALLMALFALGTSFVTPALLGSISIATGKEDQGLVLGTAQGNSSLGRIAGPLMGGFFYLKFQGLAFATAAVVDFLALLIVFKVFKNKTRELAESSAQ